MGRLREAFSLMPWHRDLDAAARTGRLQGDGRDAGTGSSAEGEAVWHVLPDPAGTAVVARLLWRMAGPLAQFRRGALVADLMRRVMAQFAAKLSRSLAGEAAAPPKSLGLLALLWALLKARLTSRWG